MLKIGSFLGMVMITALAGFSAELEPRQTLMWSFLGAPMGDTSLREMLVDPTDDQLWYVTSDSNGLYITRDGGSSWEQHLSGNIGAIALDPANPAVVYASADSVLHWSFDRGASWLIRNSFPDPVGESPTDPSPTFIDSILVSGVDGAIYVGASSMLHTARVYKSQLAGTWSVSYESDAGYHIWDLAENPENGHLFFSTEDSSHVVDPVVMRSTDGGSSWHEMTPLTGSGTSGHGLELMVHPTTNHIYFLRESSVLSVSTDSGETWPSLQFVSFGSTILADPNCSNRLFGGEMVRGTSVGGVYISDDWGQSFHFEGPANNTIASLALDSGSSTLWAVAYGAGLWELELGQMVACSANDLIFADGFETGNLNGWD
jgi:photosystem II stability/assembly factor-like uncharacterized protein